MVQFLIFDLQTYYITKFVMFQENMHKYKNIHIELWSKVVKKPEKK